ncbi:MAG: hypothetical protein K2X27_25895, partial [Candidatus Obscuribacterales bacterium]|nr:hypothetical protein [Candidatus Obscuribacterales bacterium]
MVEGLSGEAQLQKPAAAADPNREELINKLAREMITDKNALAPAAAPETTLAKYGLVTVKGISNVPAGMLHAVEHNIKHPWETVGMVAGAAAMGATLKTILPETGNAGKIAGLAIGAYFTYKSVEPVVDAYKFAGHAKTMKDLDLAAAHLGDVGGSFIVNSAISAAGYKLGAAGAERVLLSQRLDGFANVKQAFWDGVGDKTSKLTGKFSDALGMSTTPEPVKGAGTLNLSNLTGGGQKFMPSDRIAPRGVLAGEVPPEAPMEVTIQLKSKATDLAMDRALKRIALGRQAPLTDAEFAAKFGANEESLNQVSKFANENGLKVSEADLRSGRVVLSGNSGQFSEAFKTKINNYTVDGLQIRGREGALTVPNSLANHIEGVFGVDDRPQAHSYAINRGPADPLKTEKPNTFVGRGPEDAPTDGGPGRGPVEPKGARGYLPNEVADAYEFPKGTSGKGQSVAIIQMGGGIDMKNEAA